MKPFFPSLIESERLLLRPPALVDAKEIFNSYASDREVTLYVKWRPHYRILDTERFIEACLFGWHEERYSWIIRLKSENAIIGMIELRIRENEGEVGYVFARKYWGNGFATEALRKVMELVQKETRLNRVYGLCAFENHSSARVMEKAGMQLQGRWPQKVLLPNLGTEKIECKWYAKEINGGGDGNRTHE